jgi:hypothetical protein
MMDIRQPMGWFFVIVGALLIGYGLFAHPPAGAARAALTIDAWWGGVLLLFGALMLALARRRRMAHGA